MKLSPFYALAFMLFGIHEFAVASGTTNTDPIQQAQQNIEQYRKGAISLEIKDSKGQPIEGVEIDVQQTSHAFIFGSIIFELTDHNVFASEQGRQYRERFANLFNMAIFPFYWEGYENQPGLPSWEKNILLFDWCEKNGIQPKGHPLVWTHPAGTPDWLYDLPSEYGSTLLKARIIENVLGFKGRIDLWDVVNEASNTISWIEALHEPERKNEKRYGGHDKSVETVADWIAPCYEWAHASNPDATLILNDFGQIAFPPIRQRFLNLVETLQKRHTPLHGIGLQAHEPRLQWYPPQDVWDTLELYSQLKLPIHITEFHPHSEGAAIEGGFKEGNWSQETQAEYAEQMLTLAFGHPSVVSFSWWDFTENGSYINGSALLNKDMSPKPAYKTLDRLINHTWKTNETIKTDLNGFAKLRGFYGNYAVTLSIAGKEEQTYEFIHSSDAPSHWLINIER